MASVSVLMEVAMTLAALAGGRFAAVLLLRARRRRQSLIETRLIEDAAGVRSPWADEDDPQWDVADGEVRQCWWRLVICCGLILIAVFLLILPDSHAPFAVGLKVVLLGVNVSMAMKAEVEEAQNRRVERKIVRLKAQAGG